MRKIGTMWPTLKRLLAYGSPWRKPLSVAVLLLWIAAIAEVSGPLLISYFIDNMVAKSYLPLGLVAGYFQKMWDGVISRVIEALLACPFLIMAIALGAFLGPSLTNAMIAIGLSAMPIFARLTRGQVIAIRNEEYIDGARAIGLPDRWIIIKYVLPNVMSPILVQATLAIASAIIAEASLSFLGLGQQPPNPSWGSMLNTAKGFLEQAPWMSIFPGVAIFLAVQGFNLLGDGLRDALDPRHD